MSRIIRIFSLLVVSVFSVIILSTPITAGPVSQPVPLRAMYLKSDLVGIGTVSRAGQWEKIVNNNSEITYRRVLTVNIESPIKGASPGEIAVTELRRAGAGESNFSAGQRRLFFLAAAGDNAYFLLSNFHGDLPLSERELEVYAARLGELQNIYLSGERLGEQVVDWLAGMAADPVTRFDGAYDLQLIAEGGPCIDPEGKPWDSAALNRDEGNGFDPHGRQGPCAQNRDDGSGLDPNGRKLKSTANRDDGGHLDPNGRSSTENYQGSGIDPNGRKGDQGPALDPDGRSSGAAKGDEGVGIDPFGRKGDEGWGMDPNGKGPLIDPNGKGMGLDPNGKSSINGKDDGRGIDPNGRGILIDPNGKGFGVDPNGKGLGVDPNGKSSITGKDDGRGIDPNGRGAAMDPNGGGGAMDPNGRGMGIDPNGLTGDDKDAGVRIDPEGRLPNSKRSREAGVIIDPNGRGALIDPDGRGAGLDPNGRGAGIDPNGSADAGVRIDDNGRSSSTSSDGGMFIDPNGKPFSSAAKDGDSGTSLDPNGRDSGTSLDPNGRDSGTSLDPNGRDSGTSIDPSGRSFSAVNREKLIQAFLAANFNGASLSESDQALLNVVSTFRDSRVNAKLAAGFPLLTDASVSGVFLQSAARSFGDGRLEKLARLYALTFPADGGQNMRGGVDEWDGEVLKRIAVEEWDSDVVKIRRPSTASGENKGVDEWESDIIKRGLSGDALRAELLRLINVRVQLLAHGE